MQIIFIPGQRKTKSGGSISTSSQSSKISVKHINQVMEKLKNNQTRKSTAANYHAIWRQFNKFLISLDSNQMNTSWEERLILYGTHLVDTGTQSQTIKCYFSAIKHILKVDGYEWNNDKAMLTVITKSCRLLNDTLKVRLPIRRRLLDLILFEIQRIYQNKQPYLEKLYLAAFSLAYYGMMRIGEIALGPHTIKAKDIHVGRNKQKILMVLYTSKTHGLESRPQKIKIEANSNNVLQSQNSEFNGLIFCPFAMVRRFLAARGNYEKDDEQFFVFRDKSPLKPENFRELLKSIIQKLNLNPDLYNTHSMRAGRATDLMFFGYSISTIQRAMRLKCTSTVLKYIKP